MKGTRASAVMRWSRSAIMRAWRSSSMAQGPPMRARGAPPPMVRPAMATGRVDGEVVMPRSDDPWRPEWRLGTEPGGKLPRHEPRMAGELDDLHQLLLRPDPGDPDPVLLQRGQIVVVDLVPVAVTFPDRPLPVRLRGIAALGEGHRVEAEPHRPSLVRDVPLLGQEVDDIVGRHRHELGGVRTLEPADVARVLDHRALHPEADAEV